MIEGKIFWGNALLFCSNDFYSTQYSPVFDFGAGGKLGFRDFVLFRIWSI